jgi:hypothetical protein
MEGTSGKPLEAHSRLFNPYHRAKSQFNRGSAFRLEPAASFRTGSNFSIKKPGELENRVLLVRGTNPFLRPSGERLRRNFPPYGKPLAQITRLPRDRVPLQAHGFSRAGAVADRSSGNYHLKILC